MRGSRIKSLRREEAEALRGHRLTKRGFRRLKRAWNADRSLDVRGFVLGMARQDLDRREKHG